MLIRRILVQQLEIKEEYDILLNKIHSGLNQLSIEMVININSLINNLEVGFRDKIKYKSKIKI